MIEFRCPLLAQDICAAPVSWCSRCTNVQEHRSSEYLLLSIALFRFRDVFIDHPKQGDSRGRPPLIQTSRLKEDQNGPLRTPRECGLILGHVYDWPDGYLVQYHSFSFQQGRAYSDISVQLTQRQLEVCVATEEVIQQY